MRKISVLDDDSAAVLDLMDKTERLFPGMYDFRSYGSEKEYIADLKSGVRYDVAFIALRSVKDNGIPVGKKVNLLSVGTVIVFLSDEQASSSDVYGVRHAFFLTEPVKEFYLKKAYEKAEAVLGTSCFELKLRQSTASLNTADLVYISNELKHSMFHFTDGTVNTYPLPLSKIFEQLPDSFVRVHQSYCVNRDFIEMFEGDSLMLRGGETVPVSRRYFKQLRQTMNDLFPPTEF